jgi:outer membrane protein TolC
VGEILNTQKHLYSAGGLLQFDWTPGDTFYAALAAKQRAAALGHSVSKARLDLQREAADRFYELLAAEASLAVLSEEVTVTEHYASQLEGAVQVGTAFRGDLLRLQTQIARLRIQIRQAQEARQLAAARLAETLRLPPDTELRPAKGELMPVHSAPQKSLPELLQLAQNRRPEIQALSATLTSLSREQDRARLGPLIPNVQAGYSGGGLGGGRGSSSGRFGEQQDAFIGLSWKIGPGGLFDSTRQKLASSRHEAVALQITRLRAAIGREVVDASIRSASCFEQIRIASTAVTTAEEMTRLAAQRQASQIGVVLEFVLAREELAKARLAQVRAVVDFNRAQYALRFAVGESAETPPNAKP